MLINFETTLRSNPTVKLTGMPSAVVLKVRFLNEVLVTYTAAVRFWSTITKLVVFHIRPCTKHLFTQETTVPCRIYNQHSLSKQVQAERLL